MKGKKILQLNIITLMVFFLFQITSFASIPQSPKDFYYDELGILDESTKENITVTNRELEEKTGSQVIVATLNNPEGLEGNDYGTKIFNAWHIGDKTKDNGVLLLFLEDKETNQREISIITGYGIEGRLNDGKVGRIIDNFMMPYFEEVNDHDYSKGINEGFNAIVGEVIAEYNVKLTGNYDEYQEVLDDEGSFSFGTIIMMIVVFIIISNVFNMLIPRRYNPFNGGYGGGFPGGFGYPGYGGGFGSNGRSGRGSFGSGRSSGGFRGGGGSSGGGGASRKF